MGWNLRRYASALKVKARRLPIAAALAMLLMPLQQSWSADNAFKSIDTQYIAALGDPASRAGEGAEQWGLWAVDPGPRGVRLSNFQSLKSNGGLTAAGWTFDSKAWWLEEHGLIMEKPSFPIPPGRYLVTGGRETTAVLTIHPKGEDGVERWDLSDGATLHDVTHLRCRAARYEAEANADACSPESAQEASFPVAPGAAMPPVAGCTKQDYQVLIVIAVDKAN